LNAALLFHISCHSAQYSRRLFLFAGSLLFFNSFSDIVVGVLVTVSVGLQYTSENSAIPRIIVLPLVTFDETCCAMNAVFLLVQK